METFETKGLRRTKVRRLSSLGGRTDRRRSRRIKTGARKESFCSRGASLKLKRNAADYTRRAPRRRFTGDPRMEILTDRRRNEVCELGFRQPGVNPADRTRYLTRPVRIPPPARNYSISVFLYGNVRRDKWILRINASPLAFFRRLFWVFPAINLHRGWFPFRFEFRETWKKIDRSFWFEGFQFKPEIHFLCLNVVRNYIITV